VLFESLAAAAAGDNRELAECEMNLKLLAAAQREWTEKLGGPERLPNPAPGRKFWTSLAEAGLIPPDRLVCPATGMKPGPGVSTYRGPRDPTRLGDEAAIGCDDPINHPDGVHVVRWNGEVEWVKRASREYPQLMELFAEGEPKRPDPRPDPPAPAPVPATRARGGVPVWLIAVLALCGVAAVVVLTRR
jgi:hypothetical protein